MFKLLVPLVVLLYSCSSDQQGMEEPFDETDGDIGEVGEVNESGGDVPMDSAADVVLMPGQSAEIPMECGKKNVPKAKIKTQGTVTQVVGKPNNYLVELKNVALGCETTSVQAKAEMNKAKKAFTVKLQTKIAKCACTAKATPFVVALKKAPPPGLALVVINEGVNKKKPAFRNVLPTSVQAMGKKKKGAPGMKKGKGQGQGGMKKGKGAKKGKGKKKPAG